MSVAAAVATHQPSIHRTIHRGRGCMGQTAQANVVVRPNNSKIVRFIQYCIPQSCMPWALKLELVVTTIQSTMHPPEMQHLQYVNNLILWRNWTLGTPYLITVAPILVHRLERLTMMNSCDTSICPDWHHDE